jgi:hypothetical protein
MTDSYRLRFRQGLLRGMLLVAALSLVGCASLPLPDLSSFSLAALAAPSPSLAAPASLTPEGPGSVFSSSEEAAMDALAYSYLESRDSVLSERRARAGTIYPVDGGFTYDEPTVTRPFMGAKLRYRLRTTDVAHFRHYPVSSHNQLDIRSRSLSREVRVFVDRRDPLERPIFYLTPDRFMRVYGASQNREHTLARVERGTRRGATQLEIRETIDMAAAVAPDQPLALRPVPGAMPAR